MKRILISMLLVFVSYLGYSQIYVGDININKKQGIEYVELVGITKNFKTLVHVDYGQLNPEPEEIRDKKGTIARSDNIISTLNLMTENGWEFVNSYGFGNLSDNTVRYLLKKED
jgi:hypothetical protein